METQRLLTRRTVALRWGITARTIDRLRSAGLLPWIDLSAGRGERPIVRFRLQDVEQFEESMKRSAGNHATEGPNVWDGGRAE